MEYLIKYNGSLATLGIPAEVLSEGYAIAELREEQAQQLLTHPQVEYIERAEYVVPFVLGTDLSQGLSVAPFRVGNTILTGAGVLISIIDSGIDLNHPEFAGENRVVAIWDQSAEGTPPPGFFQGREYTPEEIAAGAEGFRDESGHGTAVAGIAAGANGIAPEASLIIVKLASGPSFTTDIMRGVRYSINKARELGMPCVINLSYGTNVGSHRGQSLFEGFLNQVAGEWKTLLVAAAGNEGASGHHFAGQLRTGQTVRVDFSVAYPQRSLFVLLWNNFVDTFRYELVLPNGRTTGEFTLTSSITEFTVEQTTIRIVRRDPTPFQISRELVITLLNPNGIPVGVWSLRCIGADIVDGRFDMWLPTIEEVGRETSFLESSEFGTATLPATAERVMAVGGYQPSTGALSAFSGRGERGEPDDILPDLVAPAEGIRSARPGGGYTTYRGTSMAAPYASGAAALMMEWGIVLGNDRFLYGQRIRAFLRRYAERQPYYLYPNPLWGYGVLDIPATLNGLASDVGQGEVIL